MMEFWSCLTPEELELPSVDMVKIGKRVLSVQSPKEIYDTSNFNFMPNNHIEQQKDVEFELASSDIESGGLELTTADFGIGLMEESSILGIRDSESCQDAVDFSSIVTKRVQLSSICQVHGCNRDLSSFKGYYKRHRVCEAHTKTGVVVVKGVEQRFCQQCSRFHLLSEFDDQKRSCRRRLANHNERRRKPQGNRQPSPSSSRTISFRSQQTLPTAVPSHALSLLSSQSSGPTTGDSMVDLLQLSSHLQRVDNKRKLLQ